MPSILRWSRTAPAPGLAVVLTLLAVAANPCHAAGGLRGRSSHQENRNLEDFVFCSADVEKCPNGKFVGRSPPNCAFVCDDLAAAGGAQTLSGGAPQQLTGLTVGQSGQTPAGQSGQSNQQTLEQFVNGNSGNDEDIIYYAAVEPISHSTDSPTASPTSDDGDTDGADIDEAAVKDTVTQAQSLINKIKASSTEEESTLREIESTGTTGATASEPNPTRTRPDPNLDIGDPPPGIDVRDEGTNKRYGSTQLQLNDEEVPTNKHGLASGNLLSAQGVQVVAKESVTVRSSSAPEDTGGPDGTPEQAEGLGSGNIEQAPPNMEAVFNDITAKMEEEHGAVHTNEYEGQEEETEGFEGMHNEGEDPFEEEEGGDEDEGTLEEQEQDEDEDESEEEEGAFTFGGASVVDTAVDIATEVATEVQTLEQELQDNEVQAKAVEAEIAALQEKRAKKKAAKAKKKGTTKKKTKRKKGKKKRKTKED